MVNVDRVIAEGFMSYAALDVTFTPGVYALVGPVGAGKSSVYEATYWALFGKTARGQRGVRTTYGADTPCRVTVYGRRDGVQFKVVRTAKPTVTLQIRGEKTRDAGHLGLNQQEIDRFLGLDADTFLAATLVGRHAFRFTAARDTERKEMLEALERLERWTEYARGAGALYRETVVAQQRAETARDVAQEAAVRLEESLQSATVSIAEEINAEIAGLEEELATAQTELKTIGSKHRAGQTIQDDINAATRARVTAENEHAEAERLIEWYVDAERCGECGQEITETIRRRKLRQFRDSLPGIAERAKNEINTLAVLGTELTARRDYDRVSAEIERARKRLSDALRERSEASKNAGVVGLRSELAQNREKARKHEKEAAELATWAATYAFWEAGFGRRGIVSLLIDAAVEELNAYAADVALELSDGRYSVQFDTTTPTKTRAGESDRMYVRCYVSGEQREYAALSDGQRQHVDLVGMFAWRRFVVARTQPVNLLFMDAPFEDLAPSDAQAVMRFVQGGPEDESCFVASHNPDVRFAPDGVYRAELTNTGSQLTKES